MAPISVNTNDPPGAPRVCFGAFRVSGRQLLASLVALFVVPSLLEPLGWGEAAKALLFTIVMFSALLAVSGGRRGLVLGGVLLLLPPVAALWLWHFGWIARAGELDFGYLAYLIFLVGFAAWRLLRLVIGAATVDAEVVASGISVYLMLGLLWAFLYQGVDLAMPHSFHSGAGLSESDAFYFSFCTLTTAGYGDITPLTHQARSLAVMESVTGVLYVGVFIARLLSLYSGSGRRAQ